MIEGGFLAVRTWSCTVVLAVRTWSSTDSWKRLSQQSNRRPPPAAGRLRHRRRCAEPGALSAAHTERPWSPPAGSDSEPPEWCAAPWPSRPDQPERSRPQPPRPPSRPPGPVGRAQRGGEGFDAATPGPPPARGRQCSERQLQVERLGWAADPHNAQLLIRRAMGRVQTL